MNLNFFKPIADDVKTIAPFFSMRPNKACDTGILDTYLWRDYYNTNICVVDNRAVLMLMHRNGEYFSAMPYCAEEDLQNYFNVIKQYFNEVLKKPLKIYLADEEAVEKLNLQDDKNFYIKEEVNLKDYIYDGNDLRTLPGGKFYKKRSHINKFLKTYEGRWEYKSLNCDEKSNVLKFLASWYKERFVGTNDTDISLEYEANGMQDVLKGCFFIDYFKAGGIFIDDKLEAISLGSYNPREDMACVAVEKGNQSFTGIYQVINQQFLLHEFPNVKLVNREDDLGIEGIRVAKESYNPCCYERKYMVLQKDFDGWKNQINDQFEDQS
ncbi:MAG: phosphatidylglycerol lysyltransferase domain-containing protein [Oribacterium sp.]|nr:phosphatidylglycerol lysyltransferase domain-containing protein [Oribacterium sp.]